MRVICDEVIRNDRLTAVSSFSLICNFDQSCWWIRFQKLSFIANFVLLLHPSPLELSLWSCRCFCDTTKCWAQLFQVSPVWSLFAHLKAFMNIKQAFAPCALLSLPTGQCICSSLCGRTDIIKAVLLNGWRRFCRWTTRAEFTDDR